MNALSAVVEGNSAGFASDNTAAAKILAATTDTVVISAGNLTIDLKFDSAAQSAPASFIQGVAQAATILSTEISNKITFNVNVDYSGKGGSADGGPDSGQYLDYSTIRAELINNASPADRSLFNSLPTGSSIQGNSQLYVSNAELKAFGIISPNDATTDDGSVHFDTGIPANDLVGVALHELTHAMGRLEADSVFDLFRFTSPGTMLFTGDTPAPAAYFSVDGGVTKLADYGMTSDPSDFLNTGVQGPSDPFNEFYGAYTLQQITALDLQQLNVLGFNTSITNIDYISAGQVISNTAVNYLGIDEIQSGGVANDITVDSGGSLNIDSGGSASNTIVNSGGTIFVQMGGLASATTVNSGGDAYINSGSITSGTVVNNGGKEYIASDAVASSSRVNNGGYEYVNSGGIASGALINSGGRQYIDSGGVATGSTLTSSGVEHINAAGVANGTVVNSGGHEDVDSGGIARNSTIYNGGFEVVSGGIASGAQVNSGGEQDIHFGGDTIGTVINKGGHVYIFSGGIASSTVVNSGGLMDIVSGGDASGVELSNGGQLTIQGASASVSGLVLNVGATLDFADIAVTSVAVNSANQLLVSNAKGVIEKLALTGHYNNDLFSEKPDGYGGALILVRSDQPILSRIIYNAATGQLILSGSSFTPNVQGFTPADFSLSGDGGVSYALTSGSGVKGVPTATRAVIQLSAADQLAMDGLLNKNGATANDGTFNYSLTAASGWDTGGGVFFTQNVTVSNATAPKITAVTYNAASAVFSITGTHLDNHGGANGIAVNDFKLTAGAGGSFAFNASNDLVGNLSSSGFTLALGNVDQNLVNAIVNNNGLKTTAGIAYDFTASANWDSDSGAAIKTKAVTASGVAPSISGVAYNAANGKLTLSGHSLSATASGYSITDISLTGDGGNVYTLSKSSAISTTSGGTKAVISLSVADQLAVDGLLNSNGVKANDGVTRYFLSAQSGWDSGAGAITGQSIIVSHVTLPTISKVAYNAATGVFTITGAHLDNYATASGVNLDDFKLTGGVTGGYAFDSGNDVVSNLSARGFTLTLGGADKTAVNNIVNNNGGSPLSGTSYALVVSANWDSDSGKAISKLAVTASALDVFDTQPKSKPVVISNLLEGDGQIELSQTIYTAFARESVVQTTNFSNSTASASPMDYLYYNSHTGGLYYDAGGAGSPKSPVEIAIIGVNSHPAALSIGDFKLVA
ncbi:MAG: NF038122 family metalloprotease [Methylococcales bacterium]|nr:NF038122 family metalloprotease [Methylococcales bacterium]